MNAKERRRFRRFKAPGSCFAALRAGQGAVGRITDISMGGIAFEYLDNAEGGFVNNGDPEHVDLFVSGGGFAVRRIPCRTIRDNAVAPDASIMSTVPVRVRGLEFRNLSEQASYLLGAYISRCMQH